MDEFYYLARTCLVKDEKNFDKFDRAFAAYFKGVDEARRARDRDPARVAEEARREASSREEEKKQIEALGGWDKLMETLKKRLEEQKGRHQGGNKWIGTGGTSARSAPTATTRKACASARTGRATARAVKVWDKREFRNLDDYGRARHAQHQGRAAAAAPLRARGRGRGARPRRHDPLDREERRLARPEDGARAAQRA